MQGGSQCTRLLRRLLVSRPSFYTTPSFLMRTDGDRAEDPALASFLSSRHCRDVRQPAQSTAPELNRFSIGQRGRGEML